MNDRVYACRWFEIAPAVILIAEESFLFGSADPNEVPPAATLRPQLFALGICTHPSRWRQAQVARVAGLPGAACRAMIHPLDPRDQCEHCQLLVCRHGKTIEL
jgi:hypothetical protein